MNSCPNCGRTLACPLSHCRGGQCPFCSYKAGDHEKHARAEREPPDLRRIREQLQSLGLSDADIKRFIALAKEAKKCFRGSLSDADIKRFIALAKEAKYFRRCPLCGNMFDMRKRDDIRFHNDRLCTPRQSQRSDSTRLR